MEASSDRFVRAVQQQWETHGSRALSVRRISTLADAPVSSIYHHFGSLEHLFVTAQKASLARTEAWLDERLGQFAGLSAGVAAFPPLFAGMMDEWTETQRGLAFAWRECQLLAEGSALFQPLVQEWDRLWSSFWEQVGDKLALGPATQIASRIFANESFLHMIRWRRLVDRSALDETAQVLGAWISRQPVPATPWRDYARDEALRAMPNLPKRDETATRIVQAAAQLINDAGAARLTHRAVADRAGLTLGSVSHKFATKSGLLEAGFEGLYEANLQKLQGSGEAMVSPDRNVVLAAVTDMILRAASVRGSDELIVAVARDPSLSQFGLQLRYLRGRTSMGALKALVGPGRRVSPTEAALFSSFMTSQIRFFAGRDPERTDGKVQAEVQGLLDLLDAV